MIGLQGEFLFECEILVVMDLYELLSESLIAIFRYEHSPSYSASETDLIVKILGNIYQTTKISNINCVRIRFRL